VHPRRILLPEGGEERIVRAAVQLSHEGLATPILMGDPDLIEPQLRAHGGAALGITVLDTTDPDRQAWAVEQLVAARATGRRGFGLNRERALAWVADPLVQGALLTASGQADGFVAGCTRATADVLRATIRCVGLTPAASTLSSSFYMVGTPADEEAQVLTFTDAGVVPEPTSEQLAEIALEAVRARRTIVGDAPRVAFLSYSTHGSANGPSVERVRRGLELFRAAAPGVPADGELQGDAALVPGIRARKAPTSELRGSANILVFPSLDAGNIAYKLVQRLAARTAIGPILQGAAVPCNDLSRGATVDDIVLVSCLTALQSGE